MQSNRIPSFHTTIANDVVIKLLQRNHIEHHILWREGFHNHFPHVLLTNYALGANEKIFQQEWERESQYLEPIGERKQEKITPDNFTEFLGQAEYYRNFLHFFEDQILNHPGASAEIFYHYFFHKSVFPSVLSGAVHPLIHLGYFLSAPLLFLFISQVCHRIRERQSTC